MEHKWRKWQVTIQDISASLKLVVCEQLCIKELFLPWQNFPTLAKMRKMHQCAKGK